MSCTGTTDDTAAAAKAFHAASNGAFVLVVDCPVRLKIGSDITRPIFIENDTTIEFTSAGRFIIDNVFQPAFVIANTHTVVLSNWDVEYDGGLPVNMKTGGFFDGGNYMTTTANAPAAESFTDYTATQWLTANRGIKFDHSHGNVNSIWAGPSNTSAVFFITGDTSDVTVTDMSVYAPASAGGDKFIPMVFSMTPNYKSSQTVTALTPINSTYAAIPHNMTFSNIYMDGIYFGWQGNVQNVNIDTVRAHRYGDLQDARGNNVGGVGKWFAPPHLFYLNQNVDGDKALFNKNINIHDVVDAGPRVGHARDLGGSDTMSGFAESLKIGCSSCTVDTYTSNRVDGFLDTLTSSGLTISNVTATYDSSFTHNLYDGWRFPQPPYNNVTFDNVTITDTAAETVTYPIGGISAGSAGSSGDIVLKDVTVNMKKWAATGLPVPTFPGSGNVIAVNFTMSSTGASLHTLAQNDVLVELMATPSTFAKGSATTLKWSGYHANSCMASNAWGGSQYVGGQRAVEGTASGTFNYTLTCQSPSGASSVTLPVVVK